MNIFAKRMKFLSDPSVNELLDLTKREGIISFAGGLPAPEIFPLKELEKIATLVINKYGRKAMQYCPGEGIPQLRKKIAQQYSKKWKVSLKEENVLITSGSQSALDLLGKIFIDHNDKIIVEDPTYFVACYAFNAFGAKYITVKTDKDGLIPAELEKLVKKHKPKFVYSVTSFQNPTGITLTNERRKKVAQIIKKYKTVFIEDNPYVELNYSSKKIIDLASLAPRWVISLRTVSKTLTPGLRIGIVIAPKKIISQMAYAKQGTDLCTNTLSQYIVWQALEKNILKTHLPKILKYYKPRKDVMLRALEKYAPKNVSWTKPDGGLFIWVTLPKNLDAKKIYYLAVKKGVAYVPGYIFFAKGGGKNTLRLCFSTVSEKDIEKGIKILCQLIDEYIKKGV